MNDLNVIDRFMQAFITYIDAGFGLLGGDVRFLTVTLIGIDITLAGLFWALGGDDNVIGRFIKKILYVGAFAFILNSSRPWATSSSGRSRRPGSPPAEAVCRPPISRSRG